MEVVIVAGDKDLAQMVGDHVRMQDTMRDVTYDAELVRKKWGVPPARIPDLLALMGDGVDNIPGVPGIGQKGAAALLEKYGSLDGVLAHIGELKGKQKASLEEHREAVKLYRELATVDTNVDHRRRRSTRSASCRPTRRSSTRSTASSSSTRSSRGGGAARRPGTRRAGRGDRDPRHAEAARAALAALPAGQPVALVPLFEPPGRVHHAHLVGLAVATEGRPPLYLAFRGDGAGPRRSATRRWSSCASSSPTPRGPRSCTTSKQLAILGARHGLALGGRRARHHDRVLPRRPGEVHPARARPGRQGVRAARRAAAQVADGQRAGGARARRGRRCARPPRTPRSSRPWCWRSGRCCAAPRGGRASSRTGSRSSGRSRSCWRAWSSPASAWTATTSGGWARSSARARPRSSGAIYELAGREFNIGSTKQLADVLFEELKLPVVKKTKTGYSTDAEVLERLAPKHEIAQQILAQRELAKLINTYTDVLRDAIAPETGRVHASFQQTTGVSGRLISTDPDLQRTPVRTPEGRRIRQAFVAPEGTLLVSADWSQIELRVLAHFTKDRGLVEAFRDNLDLHRRTAGMLFDVAPEEVTREQRNTGKTVNFATIYGQGATALGQILGIPRKDAQSYIEQYFAYYAGVRAGSTAPSPRRTRRAT